jgi:hypothetical protein
MNQEFGKVKFAINHSSHDKLKECHHTVKKDRQSLRLSGTIKLRYRIPTR